MQRLVVNSWMQFGARAALVIGVLLAVIACRGYSAAGDESSGEPELVVAARATLTAYETQREPTPTRSAPQPRATFTPTVAEAASECNADATIDGLPPGLPLGNPSNTSWYGSSGEGIWASPVDFGVFLSDGFEVSKGLWYAGELTPVLWYGPQQLVEMTGERLDGSGTLEAVQGRDPRGEIQWTDVMIPESGCWQLTGSTAALSLTFTVEVLPANQRPDFHLMQTLYDARPYEAPASCPVTPFAGPDARGESNFAHFWLDSNGISADVAGWFVAGEQQSMGVYGEGVVDDLTATLRSLDPGTSGEQQITTVILNSEGRVARFIFPAPGCWELKFMTVSSTATFTIYVYPAECLPVPQDGQYLVCCEEPQS